MVTSELPGRPSVVVVILIVILECFYDNPHGSDGFKTDPAPFFPRFFFFAGLTCSCESYYNFKRITYFSFSIWPYCVTVNILHFLLHAIDGLGGAIVETFIINSYIINSLSNSRGGRCCIVPPKTTNPAKVDGRQMFF